MSRTVRALALALVVALLAACDPPLPGDDPFYTDPVDLGGAPGSIIRQRTSTFTLDPIDHAPRPGVSSRQLVYRTTGALGQPLAVSGTLLVPSSPWLVGDRPLVVYAPGTRQNRAGTPGLYRFFLAHTWSTTLFPDGVYHLEVEASDLRGNTGRRRLAFTIANEL